MVVSAVDIERLHPLVDALVDDDVLYTQGEGAGDFVLVNMECSPATPCRWLVTERHGNGYCHGWLAGTEPGPLIAPLDWQPIRSIARSPDAASHDGTTLPRGLDRQ